MSDLKAIIETHPLHKNNWFRFIDNIFITIMLCCSFFVKLVNYLNNIKLTATTRQFVISGLTKILVNELFNLGCYVA